MKMKKKIPNMEIDCAFSVNTFADLVSKQFRESRKHVFENRKNMFWIRKVVLETAKPFFEIAKMCWGNATSVLC